jgi:hypothetical protein
LDCVELVDRVVFGDEHRSPVVFLAARKDVPLPRRPDLCPSWSFPAPILSAHTHTSILGHTQACVREQI